MRIIIAGIAGVGKTTVLKKLLEKFDIEIVNFGDVMFEMAGVKNRDEMRKLPYERQLELQKKAAEKIAKKENIIIDTHSTIKTPYGYLPGLPYDVLKILNPKRIILIEASPEEILARRKKDEGIRERDVESIEEIEMHQLMNRIAAMAYATVVNATVKIIKNKENKINEAVEEILKAIRE